MYLFKAKSHAAYLFKVLSEILQSNLKTSCFQIKKEGLYLRQMDSNRRTLIDIQLDAENFNFYKYEGTATSMFVGLTLSHFHKLLKSIKKKDSIGLYIKKSNPNELAIQVIPKENNRVTTSFLKIQRVQNIMVDVPTGYAESTIIPSSEFQKITKDVLGIGKSIRIKASNGRLEFGVDAGGILKRVVEFGNAEDDEEEEEDQEDEILQKKVEFDQVFYSEQLLRITKICNLASVIHISAQQNLPLLFKTRVGDLGKIQIFIKNEKQAVADCL